MNRFLVPIGFIVALGISIGIWVALPSLFGEQGKNVQQGGYLVAALIMLIILASTPPPSGP